MPVEQWLVKWRQNRNNQREEILPKNEALNLAQKKRL
jgi:hypothetical protein